MRLCKVAWQNRAIRKLARWSFGWAPDRAASVKTSIDIGTDAAGQNVRIDVQELLATRLLVQGNSGSGKSHLLRRILAVSGLPPVSIEAAGHDVNLPEGLQQQAVNDALAVERVLRDELGVAMPTDLKLRILFVRSADAYAGLIDEPLLATSAGAWSSAA